MVCAKENVEKKRFAMKLSAWSYEVLKVSCSYLSFSITWIDLTLTWNLEEKHFYSQW